MGPQPPFSPLLVAMLLPVFAGGSGRCMPAARGRRPPRGRRGGAGPHLFLRGGSSQEHATYLEALMAESDSGMGGECAGARSRLQGVKAADSVPEPPAGDDLREMSHRGAPLQQQAPVTAQPAAGSVPRGAALAASSTAQLDASATCEQQLLIERRKLLANIQKQLQASAAPTASDALHARVPVPQSGGCHLAAAIAGARGREKEGQGSGDFKPGGGGVQWGQNWLQGDGNRGGGATGARDDELTGSPEADTSQAESFSLPEAPDLDDFTAVPPGQMAMEALRCVGAGGRVGAGAWILR